MLFIHYIKSYYMDLFSLNNVLFVMFYLDDYFLVMFSCIIISRFLTKGGGQLVINCHHS